MAETAEETLIERGTENVYADLGYTDADEMFAKANLVMVIGKTLKAHRLTHAAAAKILGIEASNLTEMLNGQFGGFSSDRLMQFLTLLGQDVIISVVPHTAEEIQRGRVSISMGQGI